MRKLLAAVCSLALLVPSTAAAQITGSPEVVTAGQTTSYTCKLTKKQKQKVKRGKLVRVTCKPAG